MLSRHALTKSAVSRVGKTLAIIALVFLSPVGKVYAQPRKLSPRSGEIEGNPNDGVPTIKGLEAIYNNIISVALLFAAVVLLLMFITAGFKYLTAGGDAKAVEAAKGTLTHAIAGLIVLVLAYIIIQFIEVFTGVNLSMFTIYRR